MEKEAGSTYSGRSTRLSILAVVTHSLLPLALVPISVYVMPQFVASFTEADLVPSGSLKFVLGVTGFIYGCWYCYVSILGVGIIVDLVICFLLFRSKRKVAGDLWSGFVILIQAVFAVLFVLGLSQVWAA
jgi:hypothetical protein